MQPDYTKLNAWLAQYTDRDEMITALTAWRENRGGGQQGMQSVINVIVNRVKKRKTDFYTECTRPLQFTSISFPIDPQFNLFPVAGDKPFSMAQTLAYQATMGVLCDLTNGSTVYYNPYGITSDRYISLPVIGPVKFPKTWNRAALTFQTEVANHLFFTEA